jgi:tetraacyldisaccharide 4'-kinase
MPVKAFRTFPDHHAYTSGDVSDLARWARESDVQVVLTTQKDLVKLRLGDLGQILVFALRIGMAFLTPTGPLEEALERLRPGGNAST